MISGRRTFRRNLPHYQSDFRTYFVTFATASRWILPPIERDLTMRHIVFDHGRRVHLHAAVVMPDHVLLVVSRSEGTQGLVRPINQQSVASERARMAARVC